LRPADRIVAGRQESAVDDSRRIATALVRSAGLGQMVTCTTLWSHSTNQVGLVEVDRGAA